MEITPARVDQVQRTKRDRLVAITDDVGGIAADLAEIDERLRLRYDPDEDYFVVYIIEPDPKGGERERLVTTAQELDPRIVERMREISSSGYNFAAEVDRRERQAQRDVEHAHREERGPHLERLAHALKRDLDINNRSYRKVGRKFKKGRR